MGDVVTPDAKLLLALAFGGSNEGSSHVFDPAKPFRQLHADAVFWLLKETVGAFGGG